MTSKREKLLWIGYALVLILLFLMSSTDLIIKEEKNEIYPISVIVEEASDDYYVNFKKG
ncbi:MAG: sugar ABC transporter substrate-binding protein, partial [Hungatella sp.]